MAAPGGSFSLPNVTTGDDYTTAATLQGDGGEGKFFVQIFAAAVTYQVQLDNQTWGPEHTIAPWIGQLAETGYGIRFRSAVAGAPAQVAAKFADLDALDQAGAPPAYSLNSGGQVVPLAAGVITGSVNSDGTKAGGSGFTVTKTAAGVYAISFTTPSAVPVVVATAISASPIVVHLSNLTANGVTVTTTSGGSNVDTAFDFLAVPIA